MKYLLLLVFLLSGCVVQTDFASSGLACQHTVSAQAFGTAQIVHCRSSEGQLVTNKVLPGTAIIEPVEKGIEAGAAIGGAYGILKNAPKVTTDNTLHIRP